MPKIHQDNGSLTSEIILNSYICNCFLYNQETVLIYCHKESRIIKEKKKKTIWLTISKKKRKVDSYLFEIRKQWPFHFFYASFPFISGLKCIIIYTIYILTIIFICVVIITTFRPLGPPTFLQFSSNLVSFMESRPETVLYRIQSIMIRFILRKNRGSLQTRVIFFKRLKIMDFR